MLPYFFSSGFAPDPRMLTTFLRMSNQKGAPWAAAAALARERGIATTAKILRLEYGKLKEKTLALGQGESVKRSRAASSGRRRSQPRPPAFVELFAPSPRSSLECRVELEGRRGKMRIEFKGIATAELVALGRALWDGEG